MVFIASRAVLSPSITTVTLPGLSPTMTHGTIASWVKKPGDLLQVGDVLCEIETDKASVGYDIQEESVLAKILVPAQGPELKCGSPIALTVEDMAAYEAFLKMDPSSYAITTAPATATAAATPAAPSSSSSGSHAMVAVSTTKGPQRFSPAARHMLASQRMDPTPITGTAMHGVISKGDVILAINAGIVKANTVAATSQHSAATHASSAPVTSPAAGIATSTTNHHPSPSALAAPVQIPLVDPTGGQPVNARYTDIPNTNMLKIIEKRLTESKVGGGRITLPIIHQHTEITLSIIYQCTSTPITNTTYQNSLF